MLFPIQWDEPFGLVMIEAMACGTPVLALPGGSVTEIVREGVSGYICHSVEDLASRAVRIRTSPHSVRQYVERYFGVSRMAAQDLNLYRSICSCATTQSSAQTHTQGVGEALLSGGQVAAD
jgi:glycosyltransferase involved in cell wall biosynthesis